MEVEFIIDGKTRKVDFDDYQSCDNHSNGFSEGYISGPDQFGVELSMDAIATDGRVEDFDPNTITEI